MKRYIAIFFLIIYADAEIKIKHNGETYSLQKSETYGYRSTKGIEYRFIDSKEYKILNPGESLLIYVYQHPLHSRKEAEKYTPMYFFSTDAASVLQPLTKTNLKAAFPDHHKFHDELDAPFKDEAELYAVTEAHKKFNAMIGKMPKGNFLDWSGQWENQVRPIGPLKTIYADSAYQALLIADPTN